EGRTTRRRERSEAMNSKTIYILFAAVAVLLGVLTLNLIFSSKVGNEYLFNDLRAAKVKPEQVVGLEIERPQQNEKLVIVKSDGAWRLTQPVEARVNSNVVEGLVRELLNARKEEKNVDLTRNLGQFDLDNPSLKVTLRAGSDRADSVSFGKVTIGGE